MNYKAIYMKLRCLRPLKSYINPLTGENTPVSLNYGEFGEVRPSAFVRTYLKTAGLDTELEKFGFSIDTFTDELFGKFGEWYLPVTPALDLKLAPNMTGGDLNVNKNISIEDSTQTVLQVSVKIAVTQPDGKSLKKVTEYQNMGAPTQSHKVKEAYVYADVYTFLMKLSGVLSKYTYQAVKLLEAYGAIPTTNEQFTDETVTTPNLKTDSANKFDPVNSAGYGMGDRSTVTQTGTTTTTIKRAANISARDQIEIVRNLPNIFTDCINAVGDLLVSPECINDMYDWGLAYGCWIDD